MGLVRLLGSRANYNSYIQRSEAGAVINGIDIGSNALLCRLFSSSTNTNANATSKEVAVDQHSNSGVGRERKKSRWTSLLPRRLQRRRNEARGEYSPSPSSSLFDLDLIRTPSLSLGNSLLEASRNINRLLDDINKNLSPSQLIGRMKEKDDSYKLRFEVPGLSKDDIKITIDNGILSITGEHKDTEEDYHHDNDNDDVESSDDEFLSRRTHGYYYNTSLVLPEDIKEDGIKAELNNGVLTVVVPKDIDKKARQTKEIKIH